jgi:hypothetical protein
MSTPFDVCNQLFPSGRKLDNSFIQGHGNERKKRLGLKVVQLRTFFIKVAHFLESVDPLLHSGLDSDDLLFVHDIIIKANV